MKRISKIRLILIAAAAAVVLAGCVIVSVTVVEIRLIELSAYTDVRLKLIH